MSIAVLDQVYDEVRRLAVAGSVVAPGDFRLKKLVAPLDKVGEKAPVFARVAMGVEAVVDSTEKTASAALLELATLVTAILATQGKTGVEGELSPIETTDLGGRSTQASARALKPLLEALSSTGSGRLELVREAIEQGLFADLRLVRPALDALDDPYAEIADLVAEKVIPTYGKAAVPELRNGIDVKGRGGHVRRLKLLYALDPAGSQDLVRAAFDEGSKEMRVAAIEFLAPEGESKDQLLEQARSRTKDVRTAAVRALCRATEEDSQVVAAITKAIDGADLEAVVAAVRECKLPAVRAHVLERAEERLSEAIDPKSDAKAAGKAVERLQLLAGSLDAKANPAAEAFLLKCLAESGRVAKVKTAHLVGGTEFDEALANLLARGTPAMRKALVAEHASLAGGMLPPAYAAARSTLPPAEFYERFSPLLAGLNSKAKKRGGDRERAEALAESLGRMIGSRAYYYRSWHYYAASAEDAEKPAALDPRWLDAAVDAGSVELVCELARPGHAGANKLLAASLNNRKPQEDFEVLETMARIGHPEVGDIVAQRLRDESKLIAKSGYWYSYWHARLIADLPASALPAIEAAVAELPENMVDALADAVGELRNKSKR